ncbi:MAG: hypothetical protein CMJ83_18525 [Planctomycetes bacterium]|nr:hypothetical protein [Planctomycetota bacterium]
MTTTGTRTTAIALHGVHKVFGESSTRVEALAGIDLDVGAGEFVAIMGPSGSGKSTLLHLIGGLDVATSGTVAVGGEDLASLNDDQLTMLRRRKIGFVFQAYNLVSVLTAIENVALPLIIDGIAESRANERAGRALDLVGLGSRPDHRPGEMSGGEQQRIAIARSLVAEPVLLLADEPTGNLDSVTGDQTMRLLRRLVDEEGQTVIMVTHDARDAAMADRIVRLRDGRIVEEQTLPPVKSGADVLASLEGLDAPEDAP